VKETEKIILKYIFVKICAKRGENYIQIRILSRKNKNKFVGGIKRRWIS